MPCIAALKDNYLFPFRIKKTRNSIALGRRRADELKELLRQFQVIFRVIELSINSINYSFYREFLIANNNIKIKYNWRSRFQIFHNFERIVDFIVFQIINDQIKFCFVNNANERRKSLKRVATVTENNLKTKVIF